MIIDIHTHLLDFGRHADEKLRDDLERCGIGGKAYTFTQEEYLEGTSGADRAVVFGIRAQKTGWRVDNSFVSDFVRRHPKYVYFASIDPMDADFMEQLSCEHRIRHCKGVKLGPVYQGIHPLDPRYYRIYRYCEEQGLPIITHMATTFSSGVPLDYARPAHMDQVACDFPNLKIVMAHLAHPWIEECVAAVRHQPNLYADLSALYYRPWQFYQAMTCIQEYQIGEKILFGSDFPATTTAQSIQGVREVNRIVEGTSLPKIPSELIESILQKDSLSLLGID